MRIKGAGRCRNNNSIMRIIKSKHKCKENFLYQGQISKVTGLLPQQRGVGGAQLDGHVIKRVPAESKVERHQQFLSLRAKHECGMLGVSSIVSETLLVWQTSIRESCSSHASQAESPSWACQFSICWLSSPHCPRTLLLGIMMTTTEQRREELLIKWAAWGSTCVIPQCSVLIFGWYKLEKKAVI